MAQVALSVTFTGHDTVVMCLTGEQRYDFAPAIDELADEHKIDFDFEEEGTVPEDDNEDAVITALTWTFPRLGPNALRAICQWLPEALEEVAELDASYSS